MAAQDFEDFFKQIFGEPFNRAMRFESEQVQKLTNKLQEIAREAVKDELTRLHTEVNELRSRVATLEAERAETAAESVQRPV